MSLSTSYGSSNDQMNRYVHKSFLTFNFAVVYYFLTNISWVDPSQGIIIFNIVISCDESQNPLQILRIQLLIPFELHLIENVLTGSHTHSPNQWRVMHL